MVLSQELPVLCHTQCPLSLSPAFEPVVGITLYTLKMYYLNENKYLHKMMIEINIEGYQLKSTEL